MKGRRLDDDVVLRRLFTRVFLIFGYIFNVLSGEYNDDDDG